MKEGLRRKAPRSEDRHANGCFRTVHESSFPNINIKSTSLTTTTSKMASSKHPIKTTTNTSSNAAPSTMPPAHTFDILPALHELLARVEQAPAAADLFSGLDEDVDPSDIGSHYPPDTLVPLTPKELPEEVLKVIKPKMRAAMRAVEAAPGIEQSISEQDEEIKMLEERDRKQKEMFREMGELAKGLAGKVT